MSQISFEDYTKQQEEREALRNQSNIRYFSLSKDGQEALVRIMHDTAQDFDIVVTHEVMIDGKRVNVNCIRDAHEPIENCPLCEADTPIRSQIYIHLIEYTVNAETGQIEATPKFWQRSASYAKTLKNLMDEYGALSDNLFKIKRNGAPGSKDTTYTFMYAPPQTYPSDRYIKDINLFEGKMALGTVVRDWDQEKLKTLIMQTTEDDEIMEDHLPFNSAPAMGSSVAGDSEEITRPKRYY